MASLDLMTTTAAVAAAIIALSLLAVPGRRDPAARKSIPRPIVPERALAGLYRLAWDAALRFLRNPQPDLDLAVDTADAAPAQCDPCFIAQYAKYAHPAVPAGQMLSNIYAAQRADGFIPQPSGWRPAPSGRACSPPLHSWAEWDLYLLTGDRDRLAQVLPPLERFHRWLVDNRRAAAGLYGPTPGTATLDLSCQMALNAHHLSLMAAELGRDGAAAAFAEEHSELGHAINALLWRDDMRWYAECQGAQPPRLTAGAQASAVDSSDVAHKSVAGLWPLLAGVAPPERAAEVIAHLTDPRQFWRPTPAPAVSAQSDGCDDAPDGSWGGAVRPAANYLVVRALLQAGRPGLAKTVALEYLRSLSVQARERGALYAHCSPERDWGAGKPDATGLSALEPVAMLIEAVLGLRADARANALVWAPRLSARHGIEKLPLGDRTVSVVCAARGPGRDYAIRTQADQPFALRVVTDFARGTAWRGKKSLGPLRDGVASIEVRAGAAEYRISGEPAPDATPPAQPQYLRATLVGQDCILPSGSQIENLRHRALLRWQPCSDEDLAGYHVYRTEDHGWRKISGSPCIWSSYVDDDPPPGGCCYAVAAVDTAGNTSPTSPAADLNPTGGAPSAPTSAESA